MNEIFQTLETAGAIVAVLIALGFCIVSHELGHFLAAKWRGLHVDAFALGFRPFWRKKYKGVEYRIGYLPFGGYCEIPQIDATGDVPQTADGKVLPRAGAVDRIVTAAAGPLFNVVSSLLLGIVVWIAGIPQSSPEMREMTVRAIDVSGPEYAAGLRVGDKIVEINGKSFCLTWEKFRQEIFFSVDRVSLTVERGGEKKRVVYAPKLDPQFENTATTTFSVLVPLELHPERGSVAERAGICAGDVLTAIDGESVSDFSEYQLALDASQGRPVELAFLRGGREMKATVSPQKVSDAGRAYVRISIRKKEDGVFVASVDKNGPAGRAGIPAGAKLVSVDGRAIAEADDLPRALQEKPGNPVEIVWIYDGRETRAQLTPEILYPHSIGAAILSLDHPSPWRQLLSTLDMSWKSIRGIAVGIGHRLGWTQKQSSIRPGHMSGPLGIGMVLYDSVRSRSIVRVVYFIVVISFALAIFNLLPLPVLDGGHILFGAVELVIRRALPATAVKALSFAFMALLVALMIFVTVSDGKRLYRKCVPAEKIR